MLLSAICALARRGLLGLTAARRPASIQGHPAFQNAGSRTQRRAFALVAQPFRLRPSALVERQLPRARSPRLFPRARCRSSWTCFLMQAVNARAREVVLALRVAYTAVRSLLLRGAPALPQVVGLCGLLGSALRARSSSGMRLAMRTCAPRNAAAAGAMRRAFRRIARRIAAFPVGPAVPVGAASLPVASS